LLRKVGRIIRVSGTIGKIGKDDSKNWLCLPGFLAGRASEHAPVCENLRLITEGNPISYMIQHTRFLWVWLERIFEVFLGFAKYFGIVYDLLK
jgi:hypothetical protein